MLVFLVFFFGGWFYAISQFGWFLGIGVGWIPAAGFAYVITQVWSWALMLLLGAGSAAAQRSRKQPKD